MSPGSWSSEYQQSPILVGDSTFPVEKLRVVNVFQRTDIASSVLSHHDARRCKHDDGGTALCQQFQDAIHPRYGQIGCGLESRPF
jgi:hypothetical protein